MERRRARSPSGCCRRGSITPLNYTGPQCDPFRLLQATHDLPHTARCSSHLLPPSGFCQAATVCVLIPWNGFNFHVGAILVEAGFDEAALSQTSISQPAISQSPLPQPAPVPQPSCPCTCPACNPMHLGRNPMHLGRNPVHAGRNPMHPGRSPMHPGHLVRVRVS